MRALIIKEAISSVAMEHPNKCNCTVCRAASGDKEAFAEILLADAERLETRS